MYGELAAGGMAMVRWRSTMRLERVCIRDWRDCMPVIGRMQADSEVPYVPVNKGFTVHVVVVGEKC